MRKHPDIFIPRRELHFFDRTDNFRKGTEFYAACFAAAQGQRCVGDKTPAYSHRPHRHPSVPERIHALLPNAGIIWCLRNPIDRAYSHWWHSLTNGLDGLSFEQALARENQHLADPGLAYCQRGVYVDQVRAYLKSFPAEQMCLLLAERLFGDPEATLRQVFRFLRVDDTFVPVGLNRVYNPAPRLIRPLVLHRLMLRLLKGRPRTIRRVEKRLGQPRPLLRPDTRQALADFYRPYNDELASLTGLDLSLWAQGCANFSV
jgi:hypothetical protein